MSLVSSPPGLSTELRENPAINLAISLVMERLRLSREMALELLSSAARAKRRRMNQVAEDVLKTVARGSRASAAVAQNANVASVRQASSGLVEPRSLHRSSEHARRLERHPQAGDFPLRPLHQ
jgi:hypothetical protein